MKKIIFILVFFNFLFSYGQIFAIDINFNGKNIINNFTNSVKNQFEGKGLKTDMLVGESSNDLISGKSSADLSLGVDKNSVNFSDNVLKVIERYIFGLVGIITVGAFIYIGYMLFSADGKEDELKKALKALTYAIIGLAVIPMSYIVIKIISGFTF